MRTYEENKRDLIYLINKYCTDDLKEELLDIVKNKCRGYQKNSKFYKDTRYPISAEDLFTISVNDPEYYRDNSHLYKVTGKLNIKPGLYNKKIGDPAILRHMTEYHNNTLIEDEKLG